jgi:AbrB family transcriptional regulator (stage V sporulation protein T)
MKATGIVRRVDDLGRIVIPKEIRRTICIKEGDPMELYLDEEGGIVLKPYVLDVGRVLENAIDMVARVLEYDERYEAKEVIDKLEAAEELWRELEKRE